MTKSDKTPETIKKGAEARDPTLSSPERSSLSNYGSGDAARSMENGTSLLSGAGPSSEPVGRDTSGEAAMKGLKAAAEAEDQRRAEIEKRNAEAEADTEKLRRSIR